MINLFDLFAEGAGLGHMLHLIGWYFTFLSSNYLDMDARKF